MEAYIDFPEEDIGDESKNNYVFKIENIKNKLQSLVDQSDKLNLLEKNLRAVLIGQPNAGKSSLFNEVLGEDRALVSKIKGTTRDYLEMNFKIGDNWITLVDTAGVHDSSDDLENEGIKRTFEQIEGADIIIWVVDVSVPYPIHELNEILRLCEEKFIILVNNKIDLERTNEKIDINTKYEIEISCTTKSGIEDFKTILSECIQEILGNNNDDIMYIGQRHKVQINKCLQRVLECKKGLESDTAIEIISSDLTDARSSIDQMIGNKTNEDMLDKLFGEFCIGK